ncbi:MAG TPA: hypothetical protein VNL77_11675 [Roseiflexaceae bacterium]|nr:hypothetical protein [Roseiflexaceae bacterium]
MTVYVHDHAEPPPRANERVDDIPLLVAHLRQMDIPRLLDVHIPTRGYWSNLSLGWVATIWLAHLLSQSDAKMRHVQSWVATHPETLRWCTAQEVLPADVHDHRLRDVLHLLSDDAQWYAFEGALNRHLLQTFGLQYEQVRLQRAENCTWQVLPEGLLQIGQGRGWRPGTLRLQIVQATLDPWGIPLTTWAASGRGVGGERLAAVVAQTQASLRPGVLYVGDDVGAPEVRAAIQSGGDGYLCQLPGAAAISDATLVDGREIQPLALGAGESQPEADGYEWRETVTALVKGQAVRWDERRLLVRSWVHARTAEESLRTRVARARGALDALGERKRGKRRPRTLDALHLAVQDILETYEVQGLLTVQYEEAVAERVVRRYRGRPTSVRVERDMHVSSTVNEAALAEAVRQRGWRVYATNLPPDHLPLTRLLTSLTSAPPAFDRLNGRPLSLTPGSLQRDEYTVGLVRLLSLGLRALILLEIAVQRRLSDEGGVPSPGGGDRRRAAQHAGERLLDAFRDIVLASDGSARPGPSVTPLTALQRRVLHLLALTPEIYQYNG